MQRPNYFISTPENVDLHLELAGLGNRIYACFIDTIISYAALFLIVVFTIAAAAATAIFPVPSSVRFFITCAEIGFGAFLGLIVIFGYYIYFEGLWRGQTPGKRLVGIRVIEQNGQPVNWTSVSIRNLIRTIDMAFSLIGLLVMFIDTSERRLGDLAAATLVIRERLPKQTLPELNLNVETSKISNLDIGRLSAKEYDVLLSYIQRRNNLLLSQKPLLAQKLEHYFRVRLDQPADGLSADRFLDTVCAAYQARAENTEN